MAALPAVLAVAAAGASVYQGISASQAANSSAKLQRQQADFEQQNALANANLKADEYRRYAAKQKLQFLANGVDFSGSAVLSTNETLNEGQKEVNAITAQGNARGNLDYQEAQITQNKGRAALIGGIAGAGSSLYSSYKQGDFNSISGQTGTH